MIRVTALYPNSDGAEIVADVPNYTNVRPLIQVNGIKL